MIWRFFQCLKKQRCRGFRKQKSSGKNCRWLKLFYFFLQERVGYNYSVPSMWWTYEDSWQYVKKSFVLSLRPTYFFQDTLQNVLLTTSVNKDVTFNPWACSLSLANINLSTCNSYTNLSIISNSNHTQKI